MNEVSQQILKHYQIRKTRKQKLNFRHFIISELSKKGYDPKEEKIKSSTNIIIGDMDKADIIYTAHYDTCAMLPFPNMIIPNSFIGFILSQFFIFFALFFTTSLLYGLLYFLLLLVNIDVKDLSYSLFYVSLLLVTCWAYFGKANTHTANDNTSGVITIIEATCNMPEEFRDRVCFILFDNEEKGLLGSNALAKKYKNIKQNKLVINFDCVSDGDYLYFFPTKAMKKDENMKKLLQDSFLTQKNKHVVVNKNFGFYPSDNLSFKKAYGVCSLKKGFFYYMNRIHTPRDTMFDKENIEILSNGICRLTEYYKK